MTYPNKAFILAAGYGKRMHPHTEHTPKPLVKLNGKPLLDYTLEHLKTAGVSEIIVNAHHLAPQIEDWAKTRSTEKNRIHCITEPTILDTGGGIINALNHFKESPFYVIAGDAFWIDTPGHSTLMSLAKEWQTHEKNHAIDILMHLQNIETMTHTKGVGDYTLDPQNRVTRSLDKSGQYMFTNIRINHPRIFEKYSPEPFSFLDIMDECQNNQTFFGSTSEKCEWHHISTPEDLERVQKHVQT